MASQLKDKRVGVLVNHSSMVGNIHLLDTRWRWVDVRKVFAPEHGSVMLTVPELTTSRYQNRLPVVLYGNTKEPSLSRWRTWMLSFDIQDVGEVLLYSSMHYMMEACVEHGVP